MLVSDVKVSTLNSGTKKYFGGSKREFVPRSLKEFQKRANTNNHKCWSVIEKACGSTNVYVTSIQEKTSTKNTQLYTYTVLCNDCGLKQHYAVKKEIKNNFLKVR